MGRLIDAHGHPVYTLEAILRFVLVSWPRLIMAVGKRPRDYLTQGLEVPSASEKVTGPTYIVNFHLHRLISLFFMYLMLQVLGLLWAFLLNAGFILMLDLANLVMDRASWGEVSLTVGLATFYVSYCIFRVFTQFGTYIGVISWQSLDDFPLARRVVARAADRWNMLLLLLFFPQSLVATLLLFTPPVCETESILQYSLVDALCNHTPLKFLTQQYERPRSILTQMLFFGIMQFTQVLLHQFPDWRANLMAVRRRYRRPLYIFLLVLIFTTMPWLVRWLGFHAGYDWFRVGYLVDHQWYSRALLLGWTLWVLYLALLLCKSGKVTAPPLTDDNTLKEVFMNLKLSFIVGSSALFLRGCFHPRLGFLESQQEWAAITIVMPILYASLFAVVKGVMRMTWALTFLGGTASLLLALAVVMLSGVGGPGTLTIVWLHLFAKCVELLGRDEFGIFGSDDDSDDDNLFEDKKSWKFSETPRSSQSKRNSTTLLEQEYFFDRSHRNLYSQGPPVTLARRVSCESDNGEKQKRFSKQQSHKLQKDTTIPDKTSGPKPESYSSIENSHGSVAVKDDGILPEDSKLDTCVYSVPLKTSLSSNQLIGNEENMIRCRSDPALLTNKVKVSTRTKLGDLSSTSDGKATTALEGQNEHARRSTRERYSTDTESRLRSASPSTRLSRSLHRSLSYDSALDALKESSVPTRMPIEPDFPATLKSPPSKLSQHPDPEPKKESEFSEFMYKIWIMVSIVVLIIYILTVGTFKVLAVVQESKQWFPQVVKFQESPLPDGPLFFQHALVSNLTLHRSGAYQEPLYPRYGLCGHRWEGLSLVDYALLSELAYFDPDDERVNLPHILQALFPPEENWLKAQGQLFELRIPSEEYRRHGDAQFLEFYSAQLNLSVISIKGTDIGRIGDFVEDIKLYTEPVVFMILSSVFPTVRMWSDTTASYMVDWLHETQVLFGLRKKQEYYNQVSKYISSLQGRKIVLTGHSLGGGLARIAGALERVPSIAFSPPGLGQAYRKFHLLDHPKFGSRSMVRADLFHDHVSVVPENDPVARVDTQVGNIQNIMCKSSKLAIMNACHMLEGTICELLSHCGDDRNRFTGCQYEYNLGSLVPFFWGFIDDYIYWLLPGLALLFIFGALAIIPEI